MTFAVREELAKSFLDAADEIAGAPTRAAVEQQKQLRDKLKAKLGRIVDDYERELEPLVLAIGRLTDKDSSRFDIKNADHRQSTVSMNVQVIYTKSGTPQKFEMDSFTTIEGLDSFTLIIDPKSDRVKTDERATFADVRKALAYWFATVAPERLPELKEIMMPDRSMTTGQDMKASSPLRLKTPQG